MAHTLSYSFVLAFHGCDDAVAEKLLAGEPFANSENSYDWLGDGIYFWESNPKRGLEWAQHLKSTGRSASRISTPAVVGAVIELGFCLDLCTSVGVALVSEAHRSLAATAEVFGKPLPVNHADGRHNLDCAVINFLHEIRRSSKDDAFDTVRGVFLEGNPVYPTAQFNDKTHAQICVRNPDCIKGVFRVQERFLT